MMKVLIVSLIIKFSYQFIIKDNFYFCDIEKDFFYWDEEDNCQNQIIFSNSVKYSVFGILSKLHDKVSGDGWQCFKKKFTHEYTKTFFMEETTNLFEEIIPLTRTECEFMVEKKICGDTGIMECEGTNCQYEEKSIPKFNWFSKNIVTTYSCQFFSRTIIAEEFKFIWYSL